MKPGTPYAQTEETVTSLLEALQRVNLQLTPEQPDEQNLVRQITARYGTNIDAYESGDHVATIAVDLLNPELRTHTSSEIRQFWREAFTLSADIASLKFSEPVIGPQGKPLELQIMGDSSKALSAAAQDLKTWLSQYIGVFDVSSDLRPSKVEYLFRLRPGAQDLGITSTDLAEQLRGAFNGNIVQEIQVGREKYKVTVTLTQDAQQDRRTQYCHRGRQHQCFSHHIGGGTQRFAGKLLTRLAACTPGSHAKNCRRGLTLG